MRLIQLNTQKTTPCSDGASLSAFICVHLRFHIISRPRMNADEPLMLRLLIFLPTQKFPHRGIDSRGFTGRRCRFWVNRESGRSILMPLSSDFGVRSVERSDFGELSQVIKRSANPNRMPAGFGNPAGAEGRRIYESLYRDREKTYMLFIGKSLISICWISLQTDHPIVWYGVKILWFKGF